MVICLKRIMKSKIKTKLPKKILGRFIIIFFVPLICIQILAIFLFYDRHWEKITTRFANIASNQVNLIVSNFLTTSLSQNFEFKRDLTSLLSSIAPLKFPCLNFLSLDLVCSKIFSMNILFEFGIFKTFNNLIIN